MCVKWTDAEEALLEHLDGRYVGKKFISEYKRLAAIKKLPTRTHWAIICKAGELGITLNGGVFDSFSCRALASALNVSTRRVSQWIALGLPATRKVGRCIILVKDFIDWAKQNTRYFGGICPEALFWLTGEKFDLPTVPLKKAKPIIRTADKTQFPSIKEAARASFVGRYSITRALQLGTEAGGSKWEYVCN